jgi:ATP-dependent protease HslVU (ClpYQ) peptidase subunit
VARSPTLPDAAHWLRDARRRDDERRAIRRHSVTLGIATLCKHEDKFAVVLCADWQGTRGDFIKADDTYKIRHFDKAAILLAGDPDVGAEFAARFEAISREFNAIEKVPNDLDLRMGTYLSKLRNLTGTFISERADHAIWTKYAMRLSDFRSKDAISRFSIRTYDDIDKTIRDTNLASEFVVAYMDDEEVQLFRIFENGDVIPQENLFVTIGTGSDIAQSILCHIDKSEDFLTVAEAVSWTYEAKRAAQRNPFVGTTTTISVMLPDGYEYDLSDELWAELKRRHRPFRVPQIRWDRLKHPPLELSDRSPLKYGRGSR